MPPVGWPIQYRVSGPEVSQVQDIALRLAQTIAGGGAVKRVNFDWMEPGRVVEIHIDQDQARLVGLDSRAIGTALNGVVTGVPITQVRDDIFLVDVLGRAVGEQRVSLAKLQQLEIGLPSGRAIPLSQVATLAFGAPAGVGARVRIYSPGGRLVAELTDDGGQTGTRFLEWNGRDAVDEPVGSGVYLCELTTEDVVLRRKLTVLR